VRGDYAARIPHNEKVIRAIPTGVGTTEVPEELTLPSSGPSPRVWGLHHVVYHEVPRQRSIPTCVGTTDVVVLLSGEDKRSIPTCVGTYT
jgi:hypothetical protein